MKKIISFLLLCIVVATANSQIQRKRTAQNNKDTAAVANTAEREVNRKDMLRELNLTKKQKLQLKEYRQDAKAAMEKIKTDAALSEKEKKEKLKILRRQQMEKVFSVLNDEQKEKLKKLQKEKKIEGMDDTMTEE